MDTFGRRTQYLGLENDILMVPPDRHYHIIQVVQLPSDQLIPHIRPNNPVIHGLYRRRTIHRSEIFLHFDLGWLAIIFLEVVAIHDIRLFLNRHPDELAQIIRLHPVVGIHMYHIISRGCPQPSHPRLWQTGILLPYYQ